MLEITFRDFLKREFEMRTLRNESYSLRSFARDLNLSPGRLSAILNRGAGLSEANARRIAEVLGLSGSEAEYFFTLTMSAHARSARGRIQAKKTLQSLLCTEHGISLRSFSSISDWYHLALLELVQLSGFKNEDKWIANALGLKRSFVRPAIGRLINAGLLTQMGTTLVAVTRSNRVESGISSSSIRRFHSQIIAKAHDSVHRQSLDERYLRSLILAVDRHGMALVREKIDRCLEEIKTISEKSRKERLYCCAIQFFNLSPGENGT
ncbi:MAG: TIGR02147 family protein [Deltaproteobacteria bacterium]|nr:TIGR02147 family protein [Deltaproteobacteria bacterium]MBI3294481.1 TIGR02147 family protein [Deltaproteobacteria bacterium]